MSNNLLVPENITILPLPPKSPKLNPVENIKTSGSSCVKTGSRTASSKSYEDIVDPCCHACELCKTDPGRSCPSAAENGRMSSDQ